jgi:hypothetical protein
MNEKQTKINFVISDQTLDRREDIYALNEFGKMVNRYVLTDQIFADNFWSYLKENFNIKADNTTVFCDVHSDVKNRMEKMYRYIVKVDKPYKIIFQFYDEDKVKDPNIYNTEDEQKNKVSELMIYFDSDALEFVDKMVTEIRKMIFFPPINKTFFIISVSSSGYELRPANIKEFDIQLDLNYGDAFVEKHTDILGKIKNNKHGLFLFHGEPGTGKCVDGNTIVTLRNKKTGKIENINIEDFNKLL